MGGPAHEHTQHWQLYVTQTDSTVHSYDKTGQLCTSTHSSGPLHERRSTPSLPIIKPPVQKHCQASLTGTIPPKTHPTPTSHADRLPSSAAVHSPRPPTTLRNHRPCQVWADPAILSATVRVSWCTAAATVGDLVTPTWETYRRWSIKSVMEWLCIWRRVTDYYTLEFPHADIWCVSPNLWMSGCRFWVWTRHVARFWCMFSCE